MNRSYFADYCGRGPYAEIYREHSGVANCIARLRAERARVRSILVLGAATGLVVRDLEAAFAARAWGCELSRWAHARIPARARRRIRRADLRRYLPELVRTGRRFDVLFTSAFVYFASSELPSVLADCARVTEWLHFYASTSEDFEPNDPARVTLRPRAWWRARFRSAGFAPTRSCFLWRLA